MLFLFRVQQCEYYWVVVIPSQACIASQVPTDVQQ